MNWITRKSYLWTQCWLLIATLNEIFYYLLHTYILRTCIENKQHVMKNKCSALIENTMCDLILENRPKLSHLVFREISILNIEATVVLLC